MSKRNEQNIKKAKKVCRYLNIACAVSIGLVLLFYFCDFFNMSIDGDIQNRINGFSMAFILFGNALSNKNNVLATVRADNGGTIQFASIMSLACFAGLVALVGIFIYRAIAGKTVLSKPVIYFALSVLFMFVLQTVAFGMLTSVITNKYYAGCATCIAQSYSFITLICFIGLAVAYYFMGERLHTKFGIGFTYN